MKKLFLIAILIFVLATNLVGTGAHPTNPVEGCADANPKTELPNDT